MTNAEMLNCSTFAKLQLIFLLLQMHKLIGKLVTLRKYCLSNYLKLHTPTYYIAALDSFDIINYKSTKYTLAESWLQDESELVVDDDGKLSSDKDEQLDSSFKFDNEDKKERNPAQTLPEGAFCRRSFDGRSGYCILAYQCLHVIREYRVHGTRIDICTHRNNVPVICCPLADKHVQAQRISATSK